MDEEVEEVGVKWAGVGGAIGWGVHHFAKEFVNGGRNDGRYDGVEPLYSGRGLSRVGVKAEGGNVR